MRGLQVADAGGDYLVTLLFESARVCRFTNAISRELFPRRGAKHPRRDAVDRGMLDDRNETKIRLEFVRMIKDATRSERARWKEVQARASRDRKRIFASLDGTFEQRWSTVRVSPGENWLDALASRRGERGECRLAFAKKRFD